MRTWRGSATRSSATTAIRSESSTCGGSATSSSPGRPAERAVVSAKTKKRGHHKRSRVPQQRTASAQPRTPVPPKPRAKQPGPAPPGVLRAPPRRLYAYAVGAAVLVGALLIGLSQISVHRSTGGAPPQTSSTSGVVGAAATAALLKGIPQHGSVLGSSKAPVRLIEYADPQCPYCAMYTLNVLPTLIRDYVRPGRVQLEFRGLWFLGQDSGTALATATAAGRQNRFWNVLDLLYRNQGAENQWVTDPLLRSLVTAAGADVNRVFAERSSTAVASTINAWSALANRDKVSGVPAFFYGRRGGALNRLTTRTIAVPEFRAALDQALKP